MTYSLIRDPEVEKKDEEDYKAAYQRIRKERKFRIILGLGMIASSIVISAMMGAIFAWIGVSEDGTFWEDFKSCMPFIYCLLGAGWAIGGILTIATNIDDGLAVGFGFGLFFGTAIPGVLISTCVECKHWIIYALTFTISALVCYIVWLKRDFEEKTKHH
jgi:hypothetical protein